MHWFYSRNSSSVFTEFCNIETSLFENCLEVDRARLVIDLDLHEINYRSGEGEIYLKIPNFPAEIKKNPKNPRPTPGPRPQKRQNKLEKKMKCLLFSNFLNQFQNQFSHQKNYQTEILQFSEF